ncbi:MAG: RibD family protein [Dehalococcoidia bacterium]
MPGTPFTRPDYASLDLPDPPGDRPYVLMNMVMSADGKIVIEGSEAGLGSPSDQRLMRALRANVDAVLNGAATLRQSGASPELDDPALEAARLARGFTRTPLGVVLTRSGDLPLDSAFFASDAFEAVVFATDAMPLEQLAALRASPRPVGVVPDSDAVRSMLEALRRDFGVRWLLCEGGGHINGYLFDAGLVDECFLTVAPRIVGGNVELTPVAAGRPASFAETWPLRLVSAVPNPATSEVYLRYRVASERGVRP